MLTCDTHAMYKMHTRTNCWRSVGVPTPRHLLPTPHRTGSAAPAGTRPCQTATIATGAAPSPVTPAMSSASCATPKPTTPNPQPMAAMRRPHLPTTEASTTTRRRHHSPSHHPRAMPRRAFPLHRHHSPSHHPRAMPRRAFPLRVLPLRRQRRRESGLRLHPWPSRRRRPCRHPLPLPRRPQ